MDFGHLGLIVLLFLLALVVFGPRRMIQMVSQLGEALRQTRDAMKQMNWTGAGEAGEPDAPAKPAQDEPASGARHAQVVESAPPADSD